MKDLQNSVVPGAGDRIGILFVWAGGFDAVCEAVSGPNPLRILRFDSLSDVTCQGIVNPFSAGRQPGGVLPVVNMNVANPFRLRPRGGRREVPCELNGRSQAMDDSDIRMNRATCEHSHGLEISGSLDLGAVCSRLRQ